MLLTPIPAFMPGSTNSAAYTNFIARTSGLDATHLGAYATLLNGLTTDGFFNSDGTSSFLDCLQIYATKDSATALLNLCSASFAATLVSSPTFTADTGIAGNGSTSYINTGFNPNSGVNFTLNSAQVSMWDMSNRTTASSGLINGCYDASNFTDFTIISSGTSPTMSNLWRISAAGGNFLNADANLSTSQGFWTFCRTSSTVVAGYRNGSSTITGSKASGALTNNNFYLGARNANGTADGKNTDQFAVFSAGVGLNSTQAATLYSRIHVYMQTIAGVP